jgi:hypothetical protein
LSIPCQIDIHNGNATGYRASVRFDLFSSGRLLAALKEAGYPDLPPPRTLRSWIQNDSAPEILRVFVSAVVLERKETPRPMWAEGLEDRIAERLNSRLDVPERVVERVAARLGLPQPQSDGDLPEHIEAPRDSADTARPPSK